ncbi:MAG: hypothetical protein GWO39_12950, partial [Gammaproteobacteria bacterium]|nr:hypothetical protein [Gammaproteobacteria bacterium]NIY33215.1 hypothetical protein [Gammaproteobacteria bacterium]
MALLVVLVFAGGLGAATLLRAYARSQVPVMTDGEVSMISLTGASTDEVRGLLDLVRGDPRVGL